MNYFHKILNNPKGSVSHFDASRGFETDPEEEETEEVTKNYEYQKEVLSSAITRFDTAAQIKYERRTIKVPASIDYIKIDFLITFDNNNDYKTKDRFKRDFGLNATHFYNFNKSVLFEIEHNEKFQFFYDLIFEYINSPKTVNPSHERYAIITTVASFSFLTREEMLKDTDEIDENDNSVVLELTRKEDSELEAEKTNLYDALLSYIGPSDAGPKVNGYRTEEQYLTLGGISRNDLLALVDNFDIIASVQSIRVPRIKTLLGGSLARTFDFQIVPAEDELPLVAIIDNGVNQIAPLSGNLSAKGHTFDAVYPPYKTSGWHGTAVAVLAAVGEQFFSGAPVLKSSCQIVSYRIFEDQGGTINFMHFEQVIRRCYGEGVRLFNMSLNTFFKPYNSDYSYFSFLLDKLSYELDILFFISAGNLNGDDLHNIYSAMQAGPYHDMLDYPKHFFFPETFCDEHTCDGTNLKIPGESLNNLTVGAIAENLENKHISGGMTPNKEQPAYYTSKYHISAYHKVNGARLRSKHINYRLVKPDVVYPGGDYGNAIAGMQLTGSGIGTDFFRQECGTSFAAPFATNLAARIARLYPALNAQSIKALIINSAKAPTNSYFLLEYLSELKENFSRSEFGKTYAGLNNSERLKVNKWFNDKDLLFKLVGYGMPEAGVALSSNRKSITVILQDEITLNSHKAISIRLPKYLNAFTKKKLSLINVQATLAFKFQPNFKDQTGYNPLHMSFNFMRSFQTPDQTAENASYRDGTSFYRRLYRRLSTAKQKTARRNEELGIKANIGTWSDDFYPNGRQFSNCQKLTMPINVNDLDKTNNDISLIVRCTGKTSGGFVTKSYLAGKHPFSMVITFTEKPNKELDEYDFYQEFIDINQTLDIVLQSELDADLEAEA